MKLTEREAEVVRLMKSGHQLDRVAFSRLYGLYATPRSINGSDPVIQIQQGTVDRLKAKGIIGVRPVGSRTQWVLLEDYKP